MNRDLWKDMSFKNMNKFPCPHCSSGILMGQGKPLKVITNDGKDLEVNGYPYGIPYVFSGMLKCNNDKCSDVVVVIGEYLADIDASYQNDYREYIEIHINEYNPKFFYPNLKLFPLGEGIPKDIKSLINEAFALFFVNYSACANKIRITIEAILDYLKISRTQNSQKGKISHLSLHKRIEIYNNENAKLAKLLLALKIIGNEGSHTTEILRENILDAFEILELFILSIFIMKIDRITKLAEVIVEKKVK